MKNQILLICAIIFTLTASCGKYEEGPGFSMRSKKARVANEWKVDYAYDFIDKVEITNDFNGEVWVFKKDGGFLELKDGSTNKTGTWDFFSDKAEININFTTDSDNYTIKRLKENEMWLQDQEEEIHFVPVN